ncbi:MAG TPA: hypothetical protein VEP90_15535 [Methylomirabilota bacterium]|nr:hypothetical protein [Candidatus Acidoferrum sp.]HYT43751.1 hypothetical protein [Methylomirabilota bacterium]
MSDDYQTIANFEKIFDKLESLEGMVKSDKLDFIEYTSHNPVISELWAEGRLRALESMDIEKRLKVLESSLKLIHDKLDTIEHILDNLDNRDI